MGASEKAADLAERTQPRQDRDATFKEERARHRSATQYVPEYKSEVKLGKKLSDGKIFDRFDSNFLEPLVETRSNKILDEIQHEMTTSRNRYLPGQKNPRDPRLVELVLCLDSASRMVEEPLLAPAELMNFYLKDSILESCSREQSIMTTPSQQLSLQEEYLKEETPDLLHSLIRNNVFTKLIV